MKKLALVAVLHITLALFVGCDTAEPIAASMPPSTVAFVTPSPAATVTPAPTLSPAPTATPIPLKEAPYFSWDKPHIELPQTLYATYRLKDEPLVDMENFPDLIWDGKEYETVSEDDSVGRYNLHGSPFSNYREELSVTKRNTETETAGASCSWNWNGKERYPTMYEGTEQDAKAAVEAYFGKALGGDFMSTLSRFTVDKTVAEKKIYITYYFRSIDGMELTKPAIYAYISEEGFRWYYLDLAEYQRDSSQILEQPLTFEEALYSLNYYFETRSGHPDFLRNYKLSDAHLMLTNVFSDEYSRGNYAADLTPAWVFYLTKDKSDLDMTVVDIVYVSAQTGEIYNDTNPGGREDSPFPR